MHIFKVLIHVVSLWKGRVHRPAVYDGVPVSQYLMIVPGVIKKKSWLKCTSLIMS